MKQKLARKLVTACLVGCIIFSTNTSAHAVTHATGCGAKTTTQKCGTLQSTVADKHYLHTNVYCGRTAYIYSHKIVCSGCGVKVKSGSSKVCYRLHQYCPKENYLCK